MIKGLTAVSAVRPFTCDFMGSRDWI